MMGQEGGSFKWATELWDQDCTIELFLHLLSLERGSLSHRSSLWSQCKDLLSLAERIWVSPKTPALGRAPTLPISWPQVLNLHESADASPPTSQWCWVPSEMQPAPWPWPMQGIMSFHSCCIVRAEHCVLDVGQELGRDWWRGRTQKRCSILGTVSGGCRLHILSCDPPLTLWSRCCCPLLQIKGLPIREVK